MRADGFRPGAVHVHRDHHERSRSRHHTDRQFVLLAAQPPPVVDCVVRLSEQATGLVRRARIRACAGDVPLLFVCVAAQGGTRTQAVCSPLACVQQQAHAVIRLRLRVWRHERPVLPHQHTGRGRWTGHDGTSRRVQRILSCVLNLHHVHHIPTRILGRAVLPRIKHKQ